MTDDGLDPILKRCSDFDDDMATILAGELSRHRSRSPIQWLAGLLGIRRRRIESLDRDDSAYRLIRRAFCDIRQNEREAIAMSLYPRTMGIDAEDRED